MLAGVLKLYAHELQEIYPDCNCVKDGMKIDEFTKEEVPEYQGIDYGKITPLQPRRC